MSIKINLLPESRILTLQAAAKKRTVNTVMIVIGVVIISVIVTLLLLIGYAFSTYKATEARVNTLKKDISTQSSIEQQAATLQENLAAFASLQKSRLYVSEIFKSLGNLIPEGVKVTSFQIDGSYLVTISGTAPSFASVSTFSEALQQYNVNFKPQTNLERKPLFTNVTITSVSKTGGSASTEVNYTMTFKVDPSLFNSTHN